jgi:hypothetical protein
MGRSLITRTPVALAIGPATDPTESVVAMFVPVQIMWAWDTRWNQ